MRHLAHDVRSCCATRPVAGIADPAACWSGDQIRCLSHQPLNADRIASDLRSPLKGWPAILMVVVLTAAEAACAFNLDKSRLSVTSSPRSEFYEFLCACPSTVAIALRAHAHQSEPFGFLLLPQPCGNTFCRK